MRRLFWFLSALFGALVGALSVLIYRRYQREINALRKQVQSRSLVVQTAHGPIEYASYGEGPAVLVVHGAGGGYDQGAFLTNMMPGDFRWITMSRFGYLRTPLPENASPIDQADAHAALMDALGIPQAVIVGVSAGGPSSLQFALRYPERCLGLVMISAVSDNIPGQVVKKVDRYRWFFRSDFLTWLVIAFQSPVLLTLFGVPRAVWDRVPPDQQAWVWQFFYTALPIIPRYAGIVKDVEQISSLERYPLEQIQAPTLVIHAADDNLVPLEQGRFTAGTIPGAQLVLLDSGGHLMLGQHEVVKPSVAAFLKTHLSNQG